MDWRRTTNRLLERTGYQLIRSESLAKIRDGAERDKLRRRKRRAAAATPKPKRRLTLPADYTQDSKEIWELARGRTMIGHDKINFLCDAVRYAERYAIP